MFIENKEYTEFSKKYLNIALKSESIFEVNTGAVSRGIRKTPYPHEELLYEIKKADGKVTISSDCHDKNNLAFYFKETENLLRDVGFKCTYCLYDGALKKVDL